MTSWVCIGVLCCAIFVVHTQATCDCDAHVKKQHEPGGETSSSYESEVSNEDASTSDSQSYESETTKTDYEALSSSESEEFYEDTSTTNSQSCESQPIEKPCLHCGLNEVEACVKSCPPERTCRNRFIMYSCINDPKPCKKKCVCAEGYYRNSIGECITAAQCDQCNKPNEFYSCNSACDNECSKIGSQNRTNCPIKNKKCNEKCYCDDGYARDGDGSCIPVDQCKKCGRNEVQKCVKSCPPQKTCKNRNALYKCKGDLNCTTQCVCADGYYRNYLGDCISEEQCDQCKKPNEFYSCGGACDNECSTLGKQNRTKCPIINIKCNEKCYCEDGYARDGNGNCIPVDQCKQCGPNEVQKCVNPCPPEKSCRNRNAQFRCRGDLNCTTKCVCADGYYRNSIGECITLDRCKQCDKPNEFYSCNSACDNECDKIKTQNRTHCPILNIKCNEKCYCDDGYARDKDGNCIPVDECNPPLLNCGPHEVKQCVWSCPPEKTCKNRNIMYDCAQDDKPCRKKCVCEPGYVRNAIGQCIPVKKCDQCKKPHEFYACDSACDNECVNIDTQNRTHCPIVNVKCNKKCYCEDGYARDGDGNCIPVEQCKRCGLNEVQKCVKPCPPERTCRNRCAQYKCRADLNCTTKCVCADGYYRNSIGECITLDRCKQCDKPNEFYSCNSACDNECDKIKTQNRTHCPIMNIKCNEKCYCDDGYARDKDGNCIPVDECNPPSLNCGPHEVEQCVWSCPPEKTCKNRNIIYDCARNDKPCKKKCVCEPGYVRNAIGQCIPIKKCDQCKKPHEFYACDSACDNECVNIDTQNRTRCPIVNVKCNEKCYCEDGYARDRDGNCIPVEQCKRCGINEVQKCVKPCPPERTCRNRGAQFKCRADLNCTTKCVCADGYYRNSIGECITLDRCKQCDKPNEFYSCNSACDNECDKIKTQNRTHCPIVNIKCNEKCYCDDGYARDKDGNCIPVDKCNQPSLNCGPHEVEQCVYRCPPEKTCKTRNINIPCFRDNQPCKKKCVCEQGYVRNAIGQCIPVKKCDQCKKPHEFYACDSACDNECVNIHTQNRTHCPIVNVKCNEKCYCEDGYARDGDGNCIPVDQCKRCGPNEVQKCVKPCPPQRTCRNRDAQYKCMGNLNCTTKCVCADGYYRNVIGECITLDRCKQCDKPNEFYSCNSACDNECDKIGTQNRTHCPIKNIKCNEKCYCDDGYARDKNGNCVPVDKCKPPPLNCGPHEVEQCVKRCPPEKTCRNRGLMVRCARDDKPCKKKCVCEPGYFRNAIGKCITAKQCDKCKKPHEFYACGSACDNECVNIDTQNRTHCPIVNVKCNEKCYCEDGYARDGDGNCIPVDQCKRCGPNEVQKCVKPCPPERTCRNRGAQYKCIGNLNCTTKCVCADGYYRNAIGECITLDRCKQCDKPNEFYSCNSACDNECDKIGTQNRTHCPIKNIKCNEKCYCDDGYARDKDGNCIPVDKCKPPPLNCGPHEVEQCVKRCPPEKTCRNRGLKVRCARDDKPCKKKCVCEPGNFRNAIGQCITAKQCNKCKKTHEFYACGSACDNECVNIDTQNRTHCPIVNVKCNEKCYCEDGYARDGDGNCIPVDQCKRCGPNEVQKCVKPCPPQRTCRNRGAQYKCMGNLNCTTKCVCADGYYRNAIGECITLDRCKQCDKPNEFYSCNSACDNECDKIGTQNRTHCPIKNIKCNERCYCDDGYARDKDGNCIPVDKCKPPPLNCGLHEVEQCVKRCPPEKTCRNRGLMVRCARDDQPCKKKCVCEPGYFRNAIGQCITAKQCDQCKKPHEFYSCDSACDNECVNIDTQNRTHCPIQTYVCNKKCYCEDGYARDGDGNCIPIDQCRKCGRNEKYVQKKYTCPPETCASIVSKYNCSNAPPPKPGCACKSGFLRRNETSPCIPICQCSEMSSSLECQKENCKDPNEEFVQEKQSCPPDTCEALVARYNCSDACPPQPGCICKSGYRRLNGKCVPICECPQMTNSAECENKTCGPNEEYVKEKRTCPPETCLSMIAFYDCRNAPPPKPGCACKPGFLRRNETSPCIPTCQCSERSSSADCQKENCKDPNEEFVQEKQSCPPDTCEALVARYNCSDACPPQPGCICKSGYRRLNGKCVLICECPQMANSAECQKQTCGPNEEYVKEKRTCPPETCVSMVADYDCRKAPPPKPGCACKPGFLRHNLTSPCIPSCQCPEISSTLECQKENCKDPNEEFVQEKQSCPPDTCEALVARYNCSDACPPQPGCICKSGYRRLNGKCVPICECPQIANTPECKTPTCGENEEYVKEKQTCPPETCMSIVARYNCTNEPPRQPGCACKSGYLRLNSTLPCIPICKCPQIANTPECQTPTCGENEEYVQEKQTCPPETCMSIVARYNCTNEPPRQPGCACKSGYLRLNSTLPCMPICKCPQIANTPECKTPTCGENEEYVKEKQTCPPETCMSIVARYNCTNEPPRQPGCACKSGYLRLNSTSPCMPTCKCPQIANTPECQTPTCGENEEYVQEKQTCPPETCMSIVARYNCTNEPPRQPGCACKSGYLRLNSTSPCMPTCKCPQIANTPECQTPTCGENEEYVQEKQTCPPETCISIVARYNCTNEPPRQPGCACKSGYLRLNSTSPCMPTCKCPQIANTPECQTPTCGENEEYVQLKSTCPGDTCNALVDKRRCPKNAPVPQPGCVCKTGYRRLKTGECVPLCECPEMASAPQCQTPEEPDSCGCEED